MCVAGHLQLGVVTCGLTRPQPNKNSQGRASTRTRAFMALLVAAMNRLSTHQGALVAPIQLSPPGPAHHPTIQHPTQTYMHTNALPLEGHTPRAPKHTACTTHNAPCILHPAHSAILCASIQQDKAALLASMDPASVARLLAAMEPQEAVMLLAALGDQGGRLVGEALPREERERLVKVGPAMVPLGVFVRSNGARGRGARINIGRRCKVAGDAGLHRSGWWARRLRAFTPLMAGALALMCAAIGTSCAAL